MSEEPGDLGLIWQNATELDLTGLKCPMPALMTRRALKRIEVGRYVAVTVTDALAPLDLRHLCARDGHEFVCEVPKSDGAWRLLIRCRPQM